jgi:hypothetical protein
VSDGRRRTPSSVYGPSRSGQASGVLIEGPYPFVGEVIWLTREQGGRKDGVPPLVDGVSYAHVAHVPPATVADGSASFVLRGWDPAVWRSSAEGRWLFAANTGRQQVVPGSVVVITEGTRTVAFFQVDAIRPPDVPG